MKVTRCRSHLLLGLVLSLTLYVAGTPTVSAQPTTVPTFSLTAQGVQSGINFAPQATDFTLLPDGHRWDWSPVAGYTLPIDGVATLTFRDVGIDTDPLVYNNILVQNVSGVNQTYTFVVTLPTTWLAPNSIRGSIDTSVIGTDTLLTAPAGGSVYTALIDGSPVQTLQNAPFALGTSQSATSAFTQFGYQASMIPVNSSISIQLTFTLTPGDTAAILSDFEVIPEPGTLALLLLGGTAWAWRRQRK